MKLYNKYVLPHVLDVVCGCESINIQREKVVPLAEGVVLEVGMGSGINIPYYDDSKVDKVFGLEPSEEMREKARSRISLAPFEIELLGLPGEKIPLADDSIDTILLTYTLCTIPDWLAALKQMRRVLKPGGKLLFSEHGKAPDNSVLKWQNRLNAPWKKIAGGCNLNRDIPELLKIGGFEIIEIEALYVSSLPRFASYTYCGCAV